MDSQATYKAYDLPHHLPVAEMLTDQEAARFRDMGFLVLNQNQSLSDYRPMESLDPKNEYEAITLAAQRVRERKRAEALNRSRRGMARKRASTT
jgi:hypothetical protein